MVKAGAWGEDAMQSRVETPVPSVLPRRRPRIIRSGCVEQRTWTNRMVTDITCEKKDMLLVNYEAPNGTKRHNRLWNGGNDKGDGEAIPPGQTY